MKQKSATNPSPGFQTGQIWQMGEDRVQIGFVGNLLVHYRHFRGVIKRPPSLFSSKGELEKMLAARQAILLKQEAVPGELATPARRRGGNLRSGGPAGTKTRSPASKGDVTFRHD